MAEAESASVNGRPLTCPVCGGGRFESKRFMVAGKWLQLFDLESFGREGVLLICERCSYVQHFANKDAIELSSTKRPR